MYKNNLKEISNFSKVNNNYSDFNIVNNLLYNLNFTKYRSNNILGQSGGNNTSLSTGLPTNLPLNKTNEAEIMEIATELSVEPTAVAEAAAKIDEQNAQNLPDVSNVPPISVNPIVAPTVIPNIVTDLPGLTEPSGLINPITQIGQMDQMAQMGQMGQMSQTISNQLTSSTQTFPDKYLQRPDFVTDEIKTYTIKKGTILYHSVTNKRGFNTQNIQLGKDKIILFFTPNFRLASDKIEGCSIDKQKGYIHVFEVNQDIPNIFVKLPYDTDEDISMETLHDQFCSGSRQYNGVGFFYPKNEIEIFSNTMMNSLNQTQTQLQGISEENFYSEFGLCNPTPYLNYLYSQKCQSLRKLSQPYRIDA